MWEHMMVPSSAAAEDQHILTLSLTCSFPSPLSPRTVLSLSHFALPGPSPSPRIACAALMPVQVYRLLYEPSFLFSFSYSPLASPLLPPAFPLASSWSFDLRPPYLSRPAHSRPTLTPIRPPFLVLSPLFPALNSPYLSHLNPLGLFSHPPHPHPSHFPHVRHPTCLAHSRLAALPCPFGLPSSRLAHPCDLTLADLTLSAWILGSRHRLTLSDTCPYPLSSRQFSPSHPPHALHALLTPSTPASPYCLCRHQDVDGA